MTECNHRDNYMPLYENANVPIDDRLVPPGGYGRTYCGHMIPNHSYFVYDVIMTIDYYIVVWLIKYHVMGFQSLIHRVGLICVISCSRCSFAVTCSVDFVFCFKSKIACKRDKLESYGEASLIQHFDTSEYLYNVTILTISTSYFLYDITLIISDTRVLPV